MSIKIVDLFAGPGGLGEGFSALSDGEPFKILISAEMESSAHKTLQRRSR
jgi:DNA (cytosine-5)-methyltransferase 1